MAKESKGEGCVRQLIRYIPPTMQDNNGSKHRLIRWSVCLDEYSFWVRVDHTYSPIQHVLCSYFLHRRVSLYLQTVLEKQDLVQYGC
jgi:hypothetical protein